MAENKTDPSFVVCVGNEGYLASLQVRRLYRLIPDTQAEDRGLLRVVDEFGEDYLYPASLFEPVDLPETVERKLG